MKIRQGFVSNSSSSSFIVSKQDYVSVFELAKDMIPMREWSEDSDLIKKIEEAEIKGMDVNTGICFNSCNYETYIMKYKDYYLISTCNNHAWEDAINTIGYFPKELQNLVNYDSENGQASAFEDLEDVVPRLSSFWYSEYDIIGTPVLSDDAFCTIHNCDFIRVTGSKESICPACHYEASTKKLKEKKKKEFEELSLFEKLSFVENSIINTTAIHIEDRKKIFDALQQAKSTL